MEIDDSSFNLLRATYRALFVVNSITKHRVCVSNSLVPFNVEQMETVFGRSLVGFPWALHTQSS